MIDRIKEYGEVFTEEKEVKAMLSLLPKEVFEDISATFLEPACGDGAFIIEILKRKFLHCKKHDEFIQAVQSVYGIELQKENVNKTICNIINLCKEHFKVSKKDIKIIENQIIQGDGIKIMILLERMSE